MSVTRGRNLLTIEYKQQQDGRWLAEVIELPGVLVYGQIIEAAKLEHSEGGYDH